VEVEGIINDASDLSLTHIELVMKNEMKYPKFHISFASGSRLPYYSCRAGGNLPFSSGCYKASFTFEPVYDKY